MIRPYTIKGDWFLPTKSEAKIPGVLIYKPNEYPMLELLGSFEKPLERHKFHFQPIILGLSTNNEEITLCNCSVTSIGNLFAKKSETTYKSHLLLIGKHYNSEEEVLGTKLIVRYELLEKWVDIYSYEYKLKEDGNFSLSSYEQESRSFKIEENLVGSFRFIANHNFFPKNEFNLIQKTFLELRSIFKPLSINDFIKKAIHFRTFLMIAVGDEIPLTYLALYTGEMDNNGVEKEIQVYFNQNKPKDSIKRFDTYDFMFTYKDIESGFEQIISKWFENRNHDPLTSLIYLFYQNRESYAENTLFSAVSGLEIFHRRLRQNTELLKKDFSERMVRICENQNPLDSTFLKEKLQYGYEPSLRKRLKELFSEFDDEISILFFKNHQERLTFINKVTESRNYYTHYSEMPNKSVAQNKELILLSKKTYFLFILLVLKEIGFSNDQLKGSLNRVHHKISYFLK
jgi:hypothetical protein